MTLNRMLERIIGVVVVLLGFGLFWYIVNNVATCNAPRACSSAAAGLPIMIPMLIIFVGFIFVIQPGDKYG